MSTATTKIKVTHKSGGLRSTIRRMEQRGPLMEDHVADSVYRGTRRRCPVRTGYMRSSIKHVDNTVVVGAFYGVYVNFGTRYQAANPFFSESVKIDGVLATRKELSILMSPGLT